MQKIAQITLNELKFKIIFNEQMKLEIGQMKNDHEAEKKNGDKVYL